MAWNGMDEMTQYISLQWILTSGTERWEGKDVSFALFSIYLVI